MHGFTHAKSIQKQAFGKLSAIYIKGRMALKKSVAATGPVACRNLSLCRSRLAHKDGVHNWQERKFIAMFVAALTFSTQS